VKVLLNKKYTWSFCLCFYNLALTLKELKQIYNSLLPSEVEYLMQHYSLKGKRKRLKLFSLLDSLTVLDNAAAAKAIYQKGETASTFTHLKERVRQDMLTILMLQDTERHSKSAYRQAEIECRKLIVEGDILLKKGIYAPAMKALEKSVKLAATYELVNEKIMAEDLIRTHLGFREGPKRYEAYNDSITQNYQLLGDMLEVKNLYYGILLPNLFSPNLTNEYIEQCRTSHERMQALYARSGSANIAYYMYLTGLYYYTFLNNWEQAAQQAEHLLKVVADEPAINSFLRVANAQLQAANIATKLYNFEVAVNHAQVAAWSNCLLPLSMPSGRTCTSLRWIRRWGIAKSAHRICCMASGCFIKRRPSLLMGNWRRHSTLCMPTIPCSKIKAAGCLGIVCWR